MKIGIDARWIFREISGIGTYTSELLRNLALIDRQHHYLVFFNDERLKNRILDETGLAHAANFQAYMLPYGLFTPLNQWLMPRVLLEQGVDVYHAPNYLIPLRAFPAQRPGRVRCVTNLHDLIPLIYPQYTPRSRKRRWFMLYRWIMRQVAARADIILTGSQAARADILRHLPIPPEREANVITIPDGVAPRFQPPSAQDSRTPAAPKVILWVGRSAPYKNLLGLIAAFAEVRRQAKLPVVLRLVGARDARYPEPRQLASQLGITEDVYWVGHVSNTQLVQEYQRADVFALPSYYEGFGLPILEAMACGTPVVCSNQGSLPEVAGAAAWQVAPQDTQGLSRALLRVLTDDRLAQDMARRGLQQAAQFTWQATAQATLKAYSAALR